MHLTWITCSKHCHTISIHNYNYCYHYHAHVRASQTYHDSPSFTSPIVSPSRTLHQKHHMAFPRQKSTCSLRSWTPAISPPQSVPVVSVTRLGHLNRPYYTAIRPHLNNRVISPCQIPQRREPLLLPHHPIWDNRCHRLLGNLVSNLHAHEGQ